MRRQSWHQLECSQSMNFYTLNICLFFFLLLLLMLTDLIRRLASWLALLTILSDCRLQQHHDSWAIHSNWLPSREIWTSIHLILIIILSLYGALATLRLLRFGLLYAELCVRRRLLNLAHWIIQWLGSKIVLRLYVSTRIAWADFKPRLWVVPLILVKTKVEWACYFLKLPLFMESCATCAAATAVCAALTLLHLTDSHWKSMHSI